MLSLPRSVTDYRDQLRSLLPRGPAWSTPDGSVLLFVLTGMAEEFARVHARILDLLAESDPRSTLELLPEWETNYGLPDPCVDPPETIAERRAALVRKVTVLGGQSPQYYIDMIKAELDIDITIDEFIEGEDPYTWRVTSPETAITYFRAGEGRAGDPLRKWGDARLICLIDFYKPAHTTVLYAIG